LFSPETIRYYTEDKRLKLLDIVLHEATHNFGPHSDFQLSGKRPAEIFGGGLATVLEELKAQTGALYYLDFLRNKGILTDEQLRQVYLHAIQWCFGHIAQGMFTAEHRPKPYSQVAAVHIGFLSQAGAIVWQPDSRSADGQERGRFDIQFEKLPAAVEQLMQRIGRVKATGDKAAGKALADEYVTGPGTAWIHQAEIAERVLRHPKASFVYSVDY
jgi:hypothetical protein